MVHRPSERSPIDLARPDLFDGHGTLERKLSSKEMPS